jgi:cation transport ATPase
MSVWWPFSVVAAVVYQEFIMWVLATPVQFYIAARFYRSAWRGMRNRRFGEWRTLRRRGCRWTAFPCSWPAPAPCGAESGWHVSCLCARAHSRVFAVRTCVYALPGSGMDFLVVLGTTTAYVASVACVMGLGGTKPSFFETSALLITFVVLGKYLETVAKAKTTDALLKLLDMQPGVFACATVVNVMCEDVCCAPCVGHPTHACFVVFRTVIVCASILEPSM